MSSNEVSDNSLVRWVEEAISKNHIRLFDYKNFNNIQEIGSGGFGKVYKANYKNTYKNVVLKPFVGLNDTIVKEIIYEFKLQREIDLHDNVHLYGVTISNLNNPLSNSMLVMEHADGGTLRDYLKENFNNLTWYHKLNLAFQLACVVARLHDEGIAHRDLHANSLLVNRNVIKLADFGLSKRIDEFSTGIIPYIDPKRFNRQKDFGNSKHIYSLNGKSDVYSVGVLLWELSSGQPPFADSKPYDISLAVEILQGLRETVVPNTPDDYVKLYTECWSGDPEKRPSINEVVRRLKTIIIQTSTKICQQPNNNFSNVTNVTSNAQSFDKKNKNNLLESVDIIVNKIFKLINEGNENNGIKECIVDYISNYRKEIYELITNNSNHMNLILLLGSVYYFGINLKINYKKAFDMFRIAAKKGHLLGQYFIGLCYEFGYGTEKDVILAFKYYKKIADANCAIGEFKVGYFYDKGLADIKKDSKMAAYWYEKAVGGGNSIAQFILARMHKEGVIDKDYSKAFKLFKQLADKSMLEYCQEEIDLLQNEENLENSVA